MLKTISQDCKSLVTKNKYFETQESKDFSKGGRSHSTYLRNYLSFLTPPPLMCKVLRVCNFWAPGQDGNCFEIAYIFSLVDHLNSIKFSFQRVMPSGFFILCRFYLRIDRTLIRVIDSRIHHVKGSGKILREYTEREDRIQDLKVSFSFYKGFLIVKRML